MELKFKLNKDKSVIETEVQLDSIHKTEIPLEDISCISFPIKWMLDKLTTEDIEYLLDNDINIYLKSELYSHPRISPDRIWDYLNTLPEDELITDTTDYRILISISANPNLSKDMILHILRHIKFVEGTSGIIHQLVLLHSRYSDINEYIIDKTNIQWILSIIVEDSNYSEQLKSIAAMKLSRLEVKNSRISTSLKQRKNIKL